MIQEKQDLKTEDNPLKMILELWMPICNEKRRKQDQYLIFVSSSCLYLAWMDLPPGWKENKKSKEKNKSQHRWRLLCSLCLLLGLSESKICLFVSPIHIQTSSFENRVYSKIIVYQGRKVSKSLWIFLCVKSLWSQDRRGVKPTRLWMCVFGHSLRKCSSLKCKPQSSSMKMAQPLLL